MNRFLFAIRAIYHAPNPYHNYVHAIDVLQATYSFLLDLGLVPPYSYLLDLGRDQAGPGPWTRSDEETNLALGVGSQRAREVMRPQDVLAVLIAAMGHDVGHPGLSNAFMVGSLPIAFTLASNNLKVVTLLLEFAFRQVYLRGCGVNC